MDNIYLPGNGVIRGMSQNDLIKLAAKVVDHDLSTSERDLLLIEAYTSRPDVFRPIRDVTKAAIAAVR